MEVIRRRIKALDGRLDRGKLSISEGCEIQSRFDAGGPTSSIYAYQVQHRQIVLVASLNAHGDNPRPLSWRGLSSHKALLSLYVE